MLIGKSIRAALAGSFTLIASSATAQEVIDMSDMTREEHGDVDILFLSDIEKKNANMYSVICPAEATFGDLSGRFAATVILHNVGPEEILEEVKKFEKDTISNLSLGAQYKNIPLANFGIINQDASLSSAYNYSALKNTLNNAINTPDGFVGAPVKDPNTIRSIAKHAEEFCFSSF